MLPLVDKPIIQYGVEEAVASGRRQHHPRHGPRQERDRGSLRRLGRARDVSRSARGKREQLAGDPQDLEHDQLRLRPAGRAARPRPRGAASRASWSATSRSPCILGDDVIDADPPAMQAADRRVSSGSTARCSRSSACRWKTSRATA